MRLWGSLPLFGGEDGGTLAAWQRQDLFVLLLDPKGCRPCQALRRSLLGPPRRPTDEGVRVVAIERGDGRSDPDGSRSQALEAATGKAGAHVLVADRFARLYGALPIHGAEPEAVVAEAWAWMDYLRSQCEECGAPLDW